MSTTTDLIGPFPIGRTDAFACPVWIARLDMPNAWVDNMVGDIDALLATYRAPNVAGQHTGSVLQDRQEPWWRAYHSALFATTDALAAELDHPFTERFVRTWGVRYETPADYVLGATHLHSHMGKTFSSVIALALPPAHVGTRLGATLLRNPQANLASITTAPVEWYGPSEPLVGIIFPGPLEHQAAPPHADEAWDEARIVVVSDVAYY